MQARLKPQGKYIVVGGPNGRWIGPLSLAIKTLAFSPFVSQQFTMVLARSSQGDLTLIGELMQAGKVTPVIDRRYSLSEVPEAIRYLEQGHALGKVIVTFDPA